MYEDDPIYARAHYALLHLWTKYTVPTGTDKDATDYAADLYVKEEWNELNAAINELKRERDESIRRDR